MKPKLAPRHIIPTICYAILLVGFVLVAVLGFTLELISVEDLKGIGVIGLLFLGLSALVNLVLITIGIYGTLTTLCSFVFSSVNIAKRGRKMAVACLFYDIFWCNTFLGSLVTSLADFDGSFTFVIIDALALALCAPALVMNILNVKRNKPIVATEPSDEQPLTEQTEEVIA